MGPVMKPQRILITGGAGFLGSHLSEVLLKHGHRVTVLDTAQPKKVEHLLKHSRFRYVEGSIQDMPLMERLLSRCDLLFHLAAIADPKRYVTDPLAVLEVDLAASLPLFRICASRKIKVVFSSTSEIYGRNPSVPWKESDDRVLGATHINRWCYTTAKAACEHYLFALGQQEKLRFVILRFFNVYGPRLDDLGHGRVLPIFLKQFLLGKPVFVHGTGRQTRTFVYVTDAVRGIIRLAFLKKAEGRAFNIGTQNETSILELARLIKQIGHFRSPIRLIPYRKAFGSSFEDIPRRVPDTRALERLIRWKPRVSLRKGLWQTIAYYRKRQEPIDAEEGDA